MTDPVLVRRALRGVWLYPAAVVTLAVPVAAYSLFVGAEAHAQSPTQPPLPVTATGTPKPAPPVPVFVTPASPHSTPAGSPPRSRAGFVSPTPTASPVPSVLPSPSPDGTPGPLASVSPSPSTTTLPPASPSPGTDDPATLASLKPMPEVGVGSKEAPAARSGRVRRVVLHSDQPAPIPVGLESDGGEGTLVSFPVPIRHLDGFGVIYQPPAGNAASAADFYVLWPGAAGGAGNSDDADDEDAALSHFVVTGLRKNARKVLSVLLKGQARPFTLVLMQVDDDNAALSVQFDLPGNSASTAPSVGDADAAPFPSPSPAAASSDANGGSLFPAGWDGTRVAISPARLNGFLTKVKAYPTMSKLKPDMYQGIETVSMPETQGNDEWLGGLRTHIVRVLRDHRLDALGFEVRLENTAQKDFVYDPNALGVRIEANATDPATGKTASAFPGDEIHRARLAEAAGRVVPGGVATVFFVIAATEEGNSNDLSPRNRFRLVLSAPLPPSSTFSQRRVASVRDHSKD